MAVEDAWPRRYPHIELDGWQLQRLLGESACLVVTATQFLAEQRRLPGPGAAHDRDVACSEPGECLGQPFGYRPYCLVGQRSRELVH